LKLHISDILSSAFDDFTNMPPKQIHGKGRTLAEPSFAANTLHAFTDKENRSVVTAIGLFAVRSPRSWMEMSPVDVHLKQAKNTIVAHKMDRG
jgi:hypothetical protein